MYGHSGPGTHYLSAYGIAVKHGFVGTECEWLKSLIGPRGLTGKEGTTPHIGENGNWWIGEVDTGVQAQGPQGDPGPVYVLSEADVEMLVAEMLASNDISKMQSDIEVIRADLDYEEIAITKFTNSAAGTHEMGTVISTVNLEWTLSKSPAEQTLDGESIDVGIRSKNYMGLNITAKKTYSLTVTDERGATAAASSTIQFLNGVYYGSMAYGSTIDNAAILGLTKKLQSGKAVNFTISSDRPVYALPARYGTPTFKIGGFEYEWEKISTFDFTNASGYTESYDVWMHSQDVSGSVTVNVT